jgi:hypothetical protein
METEPASPTDSGSNPLDNAGRSSSSSDDGLLNFIQSETLQKKKLSQHVVVEAFTCTLWKGFFDMKHRLYQINNLDVQKAVDTGITLIDNLFWILFNCSSNLQLTLFLTERGRLLYSEFLSMSRTHALMQNVDVYPTIQDGFQFAIKKSIGTLTCSISENNNDAAYYCNSTEDGAGLSFENISTYRKIYRSVFEQINRNYLTNKEGSPWNADNVNLSLHKLNQTLTLAIQQHTSILEQGICVEFQDSNSQFSLLSYLLAIQLLCTSSVLNSKRTDGQDGDARLASILLARIRAVKQFALENEHALDKTLEFLSDSSGIQEKWMKSTMAFDV